jgi:hypothetical protein
VARYIRYGLMAAIAAMVALILLEVPWHSEQRFRVRSAYGDIGAAPGLLVISIGGGGGGMAGLGGGGDSGSASGGGGGGGGSTRFYIIDSAKKVICVYNMTGDKIRLVNARQYDCDTDILDASIDVPVAGGTMKAFEGGNGLSRVEAKAYSEGLKKMMDQAKGRP